MPKFEVTAEMVIYCPVKLVVEADSREDALEVVSDLIPISSYEAAQTKNGGWSAKIALKPAAGAQIVKKEVKATYITMSSGGEKVRKVSP